MSVNKVILIGHTGKDPEVRHFESGGVIANFSLATTERGYTLANGTVVPDSTEWHNITLRGGLAGVAEKFVRKGAKLYIEGRLRTRTYTDKQEILRHITEIVGENLELLDRKPDGEIRPLEQPPLPPPSNPENLPPLEQMKDDLPF
ncbi:single-stranded DNA-binding protein [Candidatus Symbiothrix dinenymphae]|nr:single-stranded DNA-binding protein [Candidatus Symbiothrix dinenymphae]